MPRARFPLVLVFTFSSILSSVVVAGCGGSAPPPGSATTPTSKTADSASSTSSTPSSGPCTATVVSKKDPSWQRVGTARIQLAGESIQRIEVVDAGGKAVPTDNAPKDRSGDFKRWIRSATCRVGGLYAWIDPGSEKAAANAPNPKLELELYKPAKDDEGRDLGSLCTRPAAIDAAGSGLDPAQETMIAAAFYEESLTSQRWRAWFQSMDEELQKASDAKATAHIRASRGDELDRAAKAAGKTTCWFATALRGS